MLPMLKVISNTTPILSLLKINRLNLLRDLYGTVIIPQAVYREIEAGKDTAFYADLTKITWIKIEQIHKTGASFYLFDLDAGEAETLILAHEQHADLVILDETIGRMYAKWMNLNLTGTIGILLKAKAQGLVERIAPLLDELREKGSWLSPTLVAKTLKLAGEETMC
jgi:predicted nucleic acid-binding protein